ncbi:ODV-E18 [Alphabaculovirus myunipunctae]|uniref:ODV-E18 n=1 Tax=Mythimna unipuncta nucleopolyhedrovirus TaxID=447897 RepID=A0A2K9VSL0_9ABAC|nr:ODV-E18 [Mythimna unipuncta nucleopolyhedrovirus]AUV65412.1 ODV-E18 [Mythimna unipuncta nucleopolyhedrovirus]
MDINRPTTTTGSSFNLAGISQNTMMMVLIALVIVILLILLFQSSSPDGSSPTPNQQRNAYMNPLNATMRANPFVNNAQRNML